MMKRAALLLLLALSGCLQYNPNAPIFYIPPPPDYGPTVVYAAPSYPSSRPVYTGPSLQTFDPGYVRQPTRTWNDTPYAPMIPPAARGMAVGR